MVEKKVWKTRSTVTSREASRKRRLAKAKEKRVATRFFKNLYRTDPSFKSAVDNHTRATIAEIHNTAMEALPPAIKYRD